MNNSRRQSMTVSNQPGKPRLSEQRLAADLEEFQKSGGAIERLGDTPLRRERSVARRRPRLQQLRPPRPPRTRTRNKHAAGRQPARRRCRAVCALRLRRVVAAPIATSAACAAPLPRTVPVTNIKR